MLYTEYMSAQDLKKIANTLRGDVLRMVKSAGAGHVAGPLSSAELFSLLYFDNQMRFDPHNPDWVERDRFVLSAGHYCPILYAALSRAGYFAQEELDKFGKLGSELSLHPEKRVGDKTLPGVETSSGPLGQGVSVAVGMALALKMDYGYLPKNKTPRVFCLLSDGEMQEGQVYEAFNFAVRRQLDNLIFILDRNRVQIERYVSEIATYGSVAGRLEAQGLYVLETDGNDVERLRNAIVKAKEVKAAPAIVVMNTVAGKGVSFMEGKPEWHDKVPSEEELRMALKELIT